MSFDRACEGCELGFDCACEAAGLLVLVPVPMFDPDWLVVVPDFDVPEGVDWGFWAGGVELCEEVELCDDELDEAAGADGEVV